MPICVGVHSQGYLKLLFFNSFRVFNIQSRVEPFVPYFDGSMCLKNRVHIIWQMKFPAVLIS